MSKRHYALIGRMAFMVIYPIWKRRATLKPRARVLIINNSNEILLVKNWLSRSQHWRLPGGGLRSRETPQAAAVREIYEEIGVRSEEDALIHLGAETVLDGNVEIIGQFYLMENINSTMNVNRREILEAQYFSIDKLPNDRSSVVDIAIGLYRDNVDKK